MSDKGTRAKEAIFKAATKLLDKASTQGEVSVRQIAKEAGVNVGALNYYFGTKDNLIREAVYQHFRKSNERYFNYLSTLDMPPEEKLRKISKDIGAFYARHRILVRISLENDIFRGVKNPNREYIHKMIFLPLIESMTGVKPDLELLISIFADAFDLAFLRAVSNNETFGQYDFFDDAQRNRLIDRIIDYELSVLKNWPS